MIEIDMLVWSYVCFVGLFSFGSSCVMAGLLYYTLKAVNTSKELLDEKVNEFDDIMRRASRANTSLGEKIEEMAAKVESLEGWRTMVGITDTSRKKWTN